MIVRISGEGQFKLPDEDAGRLNELDNRAVNAVEQGDETGFRELWSQMLEIVASDGNAVDGDELVESDVILPPRDITFDEARGEFTGDGLIPDYGRRLSEWGGRRSGSTLRRRPAARERATRRRARRRSCRAAPCRRSGVNRTRRPNRTRR